MPTATQRTQKGTKAVSTLPPAAPPPKQPGFSFMSLVQKTGTLPKTSRSRIVDPLTEAKSKIITALGQQERFVTDLLDDKPLPKAKGGEKSVSTWFRKLSDGWWTCIRYGQQGIPIGPDGETDMLIGDLRSLLGFYGAVKIAIGNGELDAQIGKLQADKSAALKSGKAK